MNLTGRELWMVVHGMGLGATFLLAYAGGLAGLWSLRPEWVTVAGLQALAPAWRRHLDHGHRGLADRYHRYLHSLPLVPGLVPAREP